MHNLLARCRVPMTCLLRGCFSSTKFTVTIR